MRIRRVRPEELEVVGAMTLAAYAPFVLSADPYAARLADATSRDRDAEIWVAVGEEDRPLGNVTVCPPGSAWRELAREGEGEFRMLAVAPSCQRHGIGEALTRAVVERFRVGGAAGIVLSTLPDMTGAHRLYERLGFERRPDRDWQPRPEVDLLAYALELS